MIEFKQTFNVHAVGQGLFYSGNIKIKPTANISKNFTFIFDCGSDNKKPKEEEIDDFRISKWPAPEKLDLLIISHFHSDHINGIRRLIEGRGLSRVITPFISYTDRIALSLIFSASGDYNPDDPDSDFTMRFIIDPVSTIREYGGPDVEIIIINSGEGDFQETVQDANLSLSELAEYDIELDFGNSVNDMNPEDRNEFRVSNQVVVKTMRDISKPMVRYGPIPIMEFLFYRKPIGPNPSKFYDKVSELFLREFQIESTEDFIQKITARGNSEKIKEILECAKAEVQDISIGIDKLKNLNTTSLSLLHFNFNNFYYLLKNMRLYWTDTILNQVTKLYGNQRILMEKRFFPYYFDDFLYPYSRFPDGYNYKFPNALLTSDGYLIEDADINSFYKRYQNYWNSFWLFQVPHHGSANNIDKVLLSYLPHYAQLFINHGIVNKHEHPSERVINDIALTGHLNSLIPINDILGIEFGLIFSKR